MIKVFFVCSGLGRTRRGYEASIQALCDVLSDESSLEIFLFKGGGKSSPKQTALWNLPRRSWLANKIGELLSVGNPWLGRGYYIEQFTFSLSLLPYLILGKPDVVYFSDKDLGDFLWHWRRLTGQKYKLLFRNGGPYPPPYNRWDHVQQVTSVYLQIALEAGSPSSQQSLVPTGFDISSKFTPVNELKTKDLRHQLNLPNDCLIILSVSAVNKSHKRLDYLIREVAKLPEPRPYLVILGQLDVESPGIIQLGNELLGSEYFQVKSVAPAHIGDYYSIADVFVLASLREGLPRVLVEAMSLGLPCLVHDYGITRFVLGDDGYFADFTLPGQLTELLQQVLQDSDSEKATHRHHSVYERFGWENLLPDYVSMIHQCAAGRTNTTESTI